MATFQLRPTRKYDNLPQHLAIHEYPMTFKKLSTYMKFECCGSYEREFVLKKVEEKTKKRKHSHNEEQINYEHGYPYFHCRDLNPGRLGESQVS